MMRASRHVPSLVPVVAVAAGLAGILGGCSSSRNASQVSIVIPTTSTLFTDVTSTDVTTTLLIDTTTTSPVTTVVATAPPATAPPGTFAPATVPLPTLPPPPPTDPPAGGPATTTTLPAGATGRYETDPSDNVRLGDYGPAVVQIQHQLILDGFGAVAPTGVYDAATKAAVTDFQRVNSLSADGICGHNTWNLLKPDADPFAGDD